MKSVRFALLFKQRTRHLMKLRLNHRSHVEYFNDIFPSALDFENYKLRYCLEKALRFHQKYLHLCLEEERMSHWVKRHKG